MRYVLSPPLMKEKTKALRGSTTSHMQLASGRFKSDSLVLGSAFRLRSMLKLYLQR